MPSKNLIRANFVLLCSASALRSHVGVISLTLLPVAKAYFANAKAVAVLEQASDTAVDLDRQLIARQADY